MTIYVFAPVHNVPLGFVLLEKIESWFAKIYMESPRELYFQGNMHLLIYHDHMKGPF